MQYRDRIKGLRRVKAAELRANPDNWRVHPLEQQQLLQTVLQEIGYADALLARELSDGSLELIDGHLRAEISPDQEVPVLVVDLDDTEAAKLLAVHDPLTLLAESDRAAFENLLNHIEVEDEALKMFLQKLGKEEKLPIENLHKPETTKTESSCSSADSLLMADNKPAAEKQFDVPELFQVIVECRDEAEQRAVFAQLQAEGYACRLLIL